MAEDSGRVAAVVAVRLGELLDDLMQQAIRLPRWRPAPIRRARLIGALEVGVTFYREWRKATGAS